MALNLATCVRQQGHWTSSIILVRTTWCKTWGIAYSVNDVDAVSHQPKSASEIASLELTTKQVPGIGENG